MDDSRWGSPVPATRSLPASPSLMTRFQASSRNGIPLYSLMTPKDITPIRSGAYRTADALICHDGRHRAPIIGTWITPAKIWLMRRCPLLDGNQSPAVGRADRTATRLVLCFGVISEYKGIPFLLDAWKRVIKEGLAGRLLVAGTGDPHLLSSIRDKVSKGGLEASVTLHLELHTCGTAPAVLSGSGHSSISLQRGDHKRRPFDWPELRESDRRYEASFLPRTFN